MTVAPRADELSPVGAAGDDEVATGGPGVPEPEPSWLGGGRWPLFAWVHRPAGGEGRGTAVLCPALFGEQSAAHPVYRSLACQLASAGVAVVRFDYEGTGDSAGPSGGPGRVAAWLDGVDEAVEHGRRFGDGPLVLLGLRSGALVAAAAAERRGDVDALVLWDPWDDGRTFLRRQRALQAMRFAVSGPLGGIEVPGYRVDAEMAAELAAVGLPASLPVRRALVVARPGRARPPLSVRHLDAGSAARATADVVVAEVGEQEGLFEVHPLERRMPSATTALVVGWLRSSLMDLAGTLGGVPTLPAPPEPPRGAVAAVPPAAPGDVTVYEEPVRLGGARLFGIETRPGAIAEPDRPVVVFLTSGVDVHTGPSRLWVTLARRWAADGVRCVRVDLSGWGDSEPRPGRAEQVLRAPEAFDDVREVVAAAGGAHRTVLVGLCSGAYQALESALEVAPLGVLAVNPLLRFTPPELRERRMLSERRRLCDPRPPWVADARTKMPRPVKEAALAVWRAARRRSAPEPGRSWLDELEQAGVRVYCLCGEAELRQLPSPPEPADPSDRRVRLELLAGLDHALLGAAQRDDVVERLTSALGWVTGGPGTRP